MPGVFRRYSKDGLPTASQPLVIESRFTPGSGSVLLICKGEQAYVCRLLDVLSEMVVSESCPTPLSLRSQIQEVCKSEGREGRHKKMKNGSLNRSQKEQIPGPYGSQMPTQPVGLNSTPLVL